MTVASSGEASESASVVAVGKQRSAILQGDVVIERGRGTFAPAGWGASSSSDACIVAPIATACCCGTSMCLYNAKHSAQ
jgi:hypothetical protein